ncbi:DUF3037 domain-containing protein [Microlunatus elymi]|uniref:DUF3037 domain-containing protein n=1 Tax=Microlunatus elymi TaxID=2596828 RepID=A0A516PXN8_9ACTN|nr:DUF3037 domain-containing protein [Microlunatus elymi]QDP95949.1 DUF3037 domain-containing protein [Microlunatus elymi]
MTLYPYSYAVLRAVPRVERGEFVNVGVIIYCQDLDFLRTAVHIDTGRIRALDHGANVELIEHAARAVLDACEQPVGSNRENSGLVIRFGMLTAPRSTVLQPSPVHVGLTSDPAATLDQLMRRLVLPPD